MINPFDRTFVHFFIGFAIILGFSFSVLYFTGKYSNVLDGKNVTASIENVWDMVVKAF